MRTRVSLLVLAFGFFFLGSLVPLALVSPASADTAVPLRPGEIGIFTSPQGLFEPPEPTGIFRGLYTLAFYVVVRPGPNGLHRARFRVENLYTESYSPLFLDGPIPVQIQTAPGIEEVGGRAEEGYFDLVDTEGCLEGDEPVLLLTVFLANNLQFYDDLILLAYDGDYVQTQSCGDAPLLPAAWNLPYDRRRAQRTNDFDCYTLVGVAKFSLLSTDHGADPGGLLTVPFSAHAWGESCGSDRKNFGISRDRLNDFNEEYCARSGDLQYCLPYDSLRAYLDWDSNLATVESVRLSLPAEANGMQLSVVQNDPGYLELLISGEEGMHFDTWVFEVDYRLGNSPAVFSPRTDFETDNDVFWDGSLLPREGPAWIRIGCEKGDVYDDDVVDEIDRDAALALASGSLEADDMTHCRADLNENGEADAGDGVLFNRMIRGPHCGRDRNRGLRVPGSSGRLRFDRDRGRGRGRAGTQFRSYPPGRGLRERGSRKAQLVTEGARPLAHRVGGGQHGNRAHRPRLLREQWGGSVRAELRARLR